MLPEGWQDDAYAATERCQPTEATEEPWPEPEPSRHVDAPDLGPRVDPDYEIRNECDSEYMCIEQRVRWKRAGKPLSQQQYDQVASYCKSQGPGEYSCIEHQLRNGIDSFAPQPAGEVVTLSLDALLDEGAPEPSVETAPSTVAPTTGFAAVEAARDLERREQEGKVRHQALYTETSKLSLQNALKKRCGRPDLRYRVPASPRSIREDMQDMNADFKKYMDCTNQVAGNWDATAYQQSLNDMEAALAEMSQSLGIDTSGMRRPPPIDKQVTAMQNALQEDADTLRKQLAEGPDWIESLYASGTYKRPNSGPSAMAIMAQSLNAINQDLTRQNQQSQQQLNQMIRQINAAQQVNIPKVSVPTVTAPRVQVPQVSAPQVAVPRVSSATAAPQQAAVNVGAMEQFACYAPGLQVCLEYRMPADAIGSFRQRCQSQGNQLLSACRPAPSACRMANFAGSVTTFNYDASEAERTRANCRQGGGVVQ